MLDSKVADLNNVARRRLRRLDHRRAVPQALRRRGEDLAALRHLRLDAGAKPGRPEGGECQAARALYALLAERYGPMSFDPRVTPARPDLAAAHLRGIGRGRRASSKA